MQRKAHFQNLTAVKSQLVQFTYIRQISQKPTKMAITIFCQKKQFCQRSMSWLIVWIMVLYYIVAILWLAEPAEQKEITGIT